MSLIFIALGQNCWGLSGKDSKTAVRAMTRNWPTCVSGKGDYEVWQCVPGSHVNNLGQIVCPTGAKAPILVSRGQRVASPVLPLRSAR